MLRGFYDWRKCSTGVNAKTFYKRLKQLDSRLKSKLTTELWGTHFLRTRLGEIRFVGEQNDYGNLVGCKMAKKLHEDINRIPIK